MFDLDFEMKVTQIQKCLRFLVAIDTDKHRCPHRTPGNPAG